MRGRAAVVFVLIILSPAAVFPFAADGAQAASFQVSQLVATCCANHGTTFELQVSPGSGPLTYQWGYDLECGTFTSTGATAFWYHPTPELCQTQDHYGTVTVVVSDASGSLVVCVDPNGSPSFTLPGSECPIATTAPQLAAKVGSNAAGPGISIGSGFPWWAVILLILVVIVALVLFLWRRGIVAVGTPPGPAPKQETPKTPETKPTEPPSQPEKKKEPDPSAPQKLAEPCLCPCPVGAMATITLKEDVTPLKIALTKQPETVYAGTPTKFAAVYDEKPIKVAYDLKQEEKIGVGNSGNVNVSYKLVIFYASPPSKECCESGKVKFKGEVAFKGSYKPWFKDKVTVKAKAPVEGEDSFNRCEGKAVDQCKIVLTGQYSQQFTVDVPANPVPGLHSWDDASVDVDRTFTIEITTKKIG